MSDKSVPYLCGGIFFSLLIELQYNTTEESKAIGRTDKTIFNTKIMENLIRVFTPKYRSHHNSNSFRKTVSEYHSCKSHGGTIIPFERLSTETNIKQSFKDEYKEILGRMEEFIAKSFPKCNNKSAMLLIKRTLMIIRDDKSIDNDDLFFINEDGSPLSKKQLLEKEDFNFQSFLVGIWYYIITKPTKNLGGDETFKKLFPKNDGMERQLDTSWLKPYAHDISITGLEVSGESSPKEVYEHENMAEMIVKDNNEELVVGMWDDQKYGIKDEIVKIFKEKFIQYKVYKFIPKDIENVIESLYIYREILDENAKLVMQEGSTSDCETAHNFKKMYCKWYPNHDSFFFYAVVKCNGFWRLQIPEEHILLKFPESFEYDMMPSDRWTTESFEYAIVNPILEGEQINGEGLPWKKCKGDIIFIDINVPIKTRESADNSILAETTALVDENASVNQEISASEDIPDDEDCTIIEDCYVLIDGMLELNSSIDEFMKIIKEKILKKYEGVTFDDNTRQLYNDIKQYRKSWKKFKNYLIKFRNLEKEKSQYLIDQQLLKHFSIYSAFSDFEPSPKPPYAFSELYLNLEEARKVKSRLKHYHQSLIELYTEIIGWEGNHTI